MSNQVEVKEKQQPPKETHNEISELEKEHGHIFSKGSKVSKDLLNKMKEKYVAMRNKGEVEIKVKTILGKQILDFLNKKEKHFINNPLYTYTYDIDLNSEHEMPTLIQKENFHKKISFDLDENFFNQFQTKMLILRGEKPKNEKIPKKVDRSLINKVRPQIEDNIFSESESEDEMQNTTKLKLTEDNEYDISKLKDVDITTLLRK